MPTCHQLEVRVADGGTPPLDTTFTIYVQVTPVNEFDPVITSPNPVINNVKESSLGVVITTVAATDDDDGRDGELRYSIRGMTKKFSRITNVPTNFKKKTDIFFVNR